MKGEHGHTMASVSKRENKKNKPGKEMIQGRQRGVYQRSLKVRSGMKEMNTEPAFTLCANTRAPEHHVDAPSSG